jgi:hypothetical protein
MSWLRVISQLRVSFSVIYEDSNFDVTMFKWVILFIVVA